MISRKVIVLKDFLCKAGPHLSFEFFPPKSEDGFEKLYGVMEKLKVFHPDFYSVTWGAGGSTIGKSLQVASAIIDKVGVRCLAHFTGLGMRRSDVDHLLEELRQRRISNILVLRGDVPHHLNRNEAFHDGFQYASELVKYIRSKPEHTSDTLGILVAGCPEGHPEAESFEKDMDHLAYKVNQGAEGIVTQLFFDNALFYRFCDELKARGINVPVSAGIMLVTKARMIKRVIELSHCSVPQALSDGIKTYEDDDVRMEAFGIDFATQQVKDLYDHGHRRFHFYTMNRSRPVSQVLENFKGVLF